MPQPLQALDLLLLLLLLLPLRPPLLESILAAIMTVPPSTATCPDNRPRWLLLPLLANDWYGLAFATYKASDKAFPG